MFETWFDQSRDLEALRSVLADGRADAIAEQCDRAGVHRAAAVDPLTSRDSIPRTRSSR